MKNLLVFGVRWSGMARRIGLGIAVFVFPIAAHAASPAWLTSHDAEIKTLVGKMTLAEKVGQMMQPDSGAVEDPADVETLFIGSILSAGTSDPKTGNNLMDWVALYESFQSRALKTRLAIPLLYGIDAVHGHNNVLGAVVFPHNIGLGCTRDSGLVERVAQITAKEVRATGIQWAFAPCVAVPRDIRWGRTYEGFSEDPAVVASLGLAAVKGLQGETLSGGKAVLACAKHFIGDGGTTYGEMNGKARLDQGNTVVDEATLRAIHLAGYPAAIAAGLGSIMPSYSSWKGVKCSGNKFLLTDLLKKELGFEGFLISDYNAIDQLRPAAKTKELESNNASGQVKTDHYKQCIEMSINAGMDMVMLSGKGKLRDFARQLQELVNEGNVPMARIDDAVTRILRVKFAMGLMNKDAVVMADTSLQKEFGSAAHRAVAREAVQKSVVLLKNEGKVLPLSRKAKRIHVAGRGADDLGMQCGGWTISWQGKRGKVTTGGTTILAALRQSAGPETAITVSRGGAEAAGADVAVVVVGEDPYAERNGDRADLALSPEDLAAVVDAKATGVPVVVVLLTGRPVILGEVATKADAILAAWLPGTEGQGVADVLFGDVSPTGKLSFAWPRSMGQLPLGHGQSKIAEALFPFGFGLGFTQNWRLTLDENFDGTKLNPKIWNIETGIRRDAINSPLAVDVKDGKLVITTHTGATGETYCGFVTTRNKFFVTQGKIVARCRYSVQPGSQVAFWAQSPTHGKSGDPAKAAEDGVEIDVMEATGLMKGAYQYALHWGTYKEDETHQKTGCKFKTPVGDQWHEYGVEWNGAGYRFTLDGTNVGTEVECPGSKVPEFLLFTSESKINGWSGERPKEGFGSKLTSTNIFEIDWVKAWERIPTTK